MGRVELASTIMTFRVPRPLYWLKATARVAQEQGRATRAPGGVWRHGTHEQDGPVTWETLISPAGGPGPRGPSYQTLTVTRLRAHAPSAKKSARPEVGQGEGYPELGSTGMRESDGPVVATKSGNRKAAETGGAKGVRVDVNFRRDP